MRGRTSRGDHSLVSPGLGKAAGQDRADRKQQDKLERHASRETARRPLSLGNCGRETRFRPSQFAAAAAPASTGLGSNRQPSAGLGLVDQYLTDETRVRWAGLGEKPSFGSALGRRRSGARVRLSSIISSAADLPVRLARRDERGAGRATIGGHPGGRCCRLFALDGRG